MLRPLATARENVIISALSPLLGIPAVFVPNTTAQHLNLSPFLIVLISDPSLPTLTRILNVFMNTHCAIHLPPPPPPCLATLANHPPRLGPIPRPLRKTPPQIPRPARPRRRRHRPILSPLRRPRLRLHPPPVPRLRPRTPPRLHLHPPSPKAMADRKAATSAPPATSVAPAP